MQWRRAAGRGGRADIAVDAWERLAPFVEAPAGAQGAEAAVEPVAAPAVVMGAAGAADAYRTRHQVT